MAGQAEGVGRQRPSSVHAAEEEEEEEEACRSRRRRRKEGDDQRGLCRPHSRRMRVFKHTWPA